MSSSLRESDSLSSLQCGKPVPSSETGRSVLYVDAGPPILFDRTWSPKGRKPPMQERSCLVEVPDREEKAEMRAVL